MFSKYERKFFIFSGVIRIYSNFSDERNVGDFEKCIEGALRAVRTLDSVS